MLSSSLWRLSLVTVFLAAVFLAAAAAAVETPDYDALRAARPAADRRLEVHDLELERDAFRFHFRSGAFYFLPPLADRTWGAVFVGDGGYVLSPASEQERRHLAFVTATEGFEVLRDDFDALVLLFTDDTFEELGLHGPIADGAADARALAGAASAFGDVLKWASKDFRTNFHLRLLADLLNAPASRAGCFLAFVKGRKHPPALAAIDPRGAQALAVAPLLGGEDTVFLVHHETQGGLWYLSHRKGELETGRTTPYVPLADALHYEVETVVERDADVVGATVVHFENRTPNLRVLPFFLLSTLRLAKASYRLEDDDAGAWTETGFVQEDKDEDADPGVIFPEPLARGAKVALRLEYAGKEVLDNLGDGNFAVGARTSWYPNLGIFDDLATFELTYRIPAGFEVVSVGERVSAEEAGGKNVSVWRSELPIRVAGFNYGRFKLLEQLDETSRVEIRVYTNPGTPDVIREIDAIIRSTQGVSTGGAAGDIDADDFGGSAGPELGRINTAKLAESALADGLNAARVCATYFGPLPQRHVAITQQSQWFFGQSWPSLIFMPYMAFLTGTQRAQLGLAAASEFVDAVGYHELAHQWWGHLVGWESYRDQWLSEGFAEFSAALVAQHAQGWNQYLDHWKRARDLITEKSRGSAVPNYQAGPITQGYRLATRRSPAAYSAMVYSKGGFVIHMLRMMMRQGAAPNPDARFIAMMHDFTAAWADKNPSTADFQAVVERHMVPAMNATGDGKMGWFFDQWVHGTEIPRYVSDLKVEKAGGKFRIHGTVSQEGVSPEFRAFLPLYVEFKKGEYGQFGAVPMIGSTSRPIDVELDLPAKPRRALVNAYYDVLARE